METNRKPGLLALDIGTTHCKAALFADDGNLLRQAKRHTPSYKQDGLELYDPQEIWETTVGMIQEVMREASKVSVAAVGITSMAESGLLVDRQTGAARSPFVPWFSTCAAQEAERISAEIDPFERFKATGLRSSFKYGLAKLLWIRDKDSGALHNTVWLSASDYIAYRFTGKFGTDYTLAARTFAYRIDHKAWDHQWLRHWGLSPSLFPEARNSTEPVGQVTADINQSLMIPSGIPVVIAGHDHVVASLAAAAANPGSIMDSMGTAETLVGTMKERELTKQDMDSGLSFGCHPLPDTLFWMGGSSASGGSVEWLRSLMGDPPLSYEQVLQLLEGASGEPTGIYYLPYLSGSGAPTPDGRAKAAFVGLTAAHGRADVLKAILEGTAYEMESIRRTAEKVTGRQSDRIVVVGGGAHNPIWLQIKANISGVSLDCPDLPEAALLGAAMLAGIGCGLYANMQEANSAVAPHINQVHFSSDKHQHESYIQHYEQGYMALQTPLRAFYHVNIRER